jgi:hypothetical protein
MMMMMMRRRRTIIMMIFNKASVTVQTVESIGKR